MNMTARETFSFQTEGKQLLDLMIHSVYSNREIFLRELISNASDALDKLRVAALTDEKLSPLFADAHIRIALDGTRRLLSVEDNGIGMNRDDLIAYLGTIAKIGDEGVHPVSGREARGPDGRADRPVRRGILFLLHGGRLRRGPDAQGR